MVRHVVIPTRFTRSTLVPLVEVCQTVATVVLVHTEEGHPVLQGTVPVFATNSLSIQRWWNAGLDHCFGPTLVLNDDVVADANSLRRLFDALDDADLVYISGHRVGHRTPLTGWCFGLYPDRLRPDEAFQWWGGDDDLYLRAESAGMRILAVDAPEIVHARGSAAFENPAHALMTGPDMALLAERWD